MIFKKKSLLKTRWLYFATISILLFGNYDNADADWLSDVKSIFKKEPLILLKCTGPLFAGIQGTYELNPNSKEVTLVEDNIGVQTDMKFNTEEFNDRIIRINITLQQVMAAMYKGISKTDFDKRSNDFDEMGHSLEEFKSNLKSKLVNKFKKEGIHQNEMDKRVKELMKGTLNYKRKIEIDRFSGEIRWIEPFQKGLYGGPDLKYKVERGKCHKLEKQKF